MRKIVIVCTIVITSTFFQSCTHPSLSNQTNLDKPRPEASTASGRIYDCAANGLYALCSKSNIQITYEECCELLPFTNKGNSMLEFKAALVSLGFQVEAQRLTVDELANIRVPSILLMLPTESPYATLALSSGHYLVLWPLDEERIQILDYPREPIVLSMDYWSEHLHDIGVKNIPILLCGKEGQSLEDMLLPSEVTAKLSTMTKTSTNKSGTD